MVTAIFPGTFDPITNGHADIATRASTLFDRVIIAVNDSDNKQTLFSIDERIALANEVMFSSANVDVISFNGLVTDLAREQKAKVIVRGIRAVSDFDYEFQMAGMNRQLCTETETVFLTPAENLGYTSSSLIKEIASLDGDVSKFVHKKIEAALKEKFS